MILTIGGSCSRCSILEQEHLRGTCENRASELPVDVCLEQLFYYLFCVFLLELHGSAYNGHYRNFIESH